MTAYRAGGDALPLLTELQKIATGVLWRWRTKFRRYDTDELITMLSLHCLTVQHKADIEKPVFNYFSTCCFNMLSALYRDERQEDKLFEALRHRQLNDTKRRNGTTIDNQ